MADLPINSNDAQPINIVDSASNTTLATVKAASTAAVAGDTSLVVAHSPNSPTPTGTNNIGNVGVAQASTTTGQIGELVQGAVTTAAPTYTTGQTSPLSLDTTGNLRVTLAGDVPTSIVGNKTNNNAVPGATNVGTLPAIANAATQTWTEGDQVAESVDLSGRQRIRGTLTSNNAAPGADNIGALTAIASATNPTYTAGDQVLLSTDLTGNLQTQDSSDGSVTGGTAGTTSMLVGGTFNTTIPAYTNGQQGAVQVDARGAQIFTRIDGCRATYSSGLQFVAANAATDIVTISGSATKVIRVNKIILSGTQTTAGVTTLYLFRRSTANTGGTLSGGVTLIPFDTTNPAATATVNVYLGNPTALGTTVGAFDIFKIYFPAVAQASDYTPRIVQFGDSTGQSFVLRGAAQILALNLNGVTLAGNSLDITIEWTEE